MPLIIGVALLASLKMPTVRRWLPWAVAGLVLFGALDTSLQAMRGVDLFGLHPFGHRFNGFLPHPNDAALWACLLPWTPWMLWPVSGLLILASASRTALGGALLVGIVVAPRRWRGWLALAAGIGFVGLLVFWAQLGHGGQTNGRARLGMWWVGWQMFMGAPWLGQGPARFVDVYLPLLQRLGPEVLGTPTEWAFIPWAHNLWIEALAERGVLGLLAWSLPLLWVWRRGSQPVRAALAAFLLMGLVDLTMLKPWVMAVYWGLVTMGLGDV